MPRPTLQMVIMVAGAVMLIIGATIVVVQLELEAKTTLLHGKCAACVAGANETVRVISGERTVELAYAGSILAGIGATLAVIAAAMRPGRNVGRCHH